MDHIGRVSFYASPEIEKIWSIFLLHIHWNKFLKVYSPLKFSRLSAWARWWIDRSSICRFPKWSTAWVLHFKGHSFLYYGQHFQTKPPNWKYVYKGGVTIVKSEVDSTVLRLRKSALPDYLIEFVAIYISMISGGISNWVDDGIAQQF